MLAGAMAVLGTELALVTDAALGLIALAGAALVLLFAWIEVRADRQGLTVRYGPLGWPRTRFALDEIERAVVVEVRPMSHGGWGYRGSVRLFGGASVIVRSGEAIQLDLRGGKRFTVTADRAPVGAGIINDLLGA